MSQTSTDHKIMADEKAQNTSAVSGPEIVESSPSTVRWSSIDDGKGDGYIFLLIFSLFLGVFVMALDQTIIGTAVPAITSEFNSLDDIAWYGSGYLLTITAFQPTFGKLYQFLRAKTVFMACVVVFEVGSILCAAAPSSDVFIAGRAIAGTGAAGLFQGALAIITRTIRLEKRPLCISIVTSTFAVSVAIGPVIGGAFADRVSWRWCFWINVPIGGVVLILIFFLLHIPKDVRSAEFQSLSLLQKIVKLDPVGAIFIIGAVVSILLALQWGGQSLPFNSSVVIGLLVGFGLLLIAFFVIQYLQGDDATLPLGLLRQRSILAGALFSLFISMPSYVYGYYIPIYFQAVKETSATISGTRYLALVLPQLFGVVLTGALVTMFGFYTPYMILGTAIAVVGSGLLLTFKLNTSAAQWASYLVICGLGTGFSINLPYTIVQTILEEDRAPMGNAAFQFMFQLGGALGLSISQTIFLNRLKSAAMDLTPSIPYSAIMQAGAYNLRRIASTPEIYDNLRQVYNNALHDTYIYPVAVAGAALLACLGLEHKNIKQVEKERAQAKLDKKEDAKEG